MAKQITWVRCGRNHIQIGLGDEPGEKAFRAACGVRKAFAVDKGDVIQDYVMGPTKVLVRFKLRSDADLKDWADRLVRAINRAAGSRRSRQHRKRLRIAYNGRDLKRAASLAELSAEDLTGIHLRTTYEVCAIGGSPGFVHLAGLDERLHLPPPDKPQARVKAGSVVLSGPDCFLVGVDQPGPWHVIAQTEDAAFDVTRESPFLLEPCDLVRFKTADEAESGEES